MKNFNFKTLLLAIGLVVASVQPSWARTYSGSEKLYVSNIYVGDYTANWVTGSGKIYGYFYNASTNKWSDAGTYTNHEETMSNGKFGVYELTVPQGNWTNVILTRGTAATFDGSSGFWNKSKDITLGDHNWIYNFSPSTYTDDYISWNDIAQNATFLFDNSSTNWASTIQMWLGRNDYTSCVTLTNITNTKLMQGTLSWFANYTKYGFCEANWNTGGFDIAQLTTQITNHTNLLEAKENPCGYNLYKGGTTISRTSLGSYSALNKSIDIAAKVGGTEAATPGKLTASSYKFSDYNICGTETSATLSAGSSVASCVVGYTAKTTLTATDANGYTFTGWYNGSTLVSSNKSITVYPHGDETYYACYTPQTYAINYKDGGNTAFSGEHEQGYPTTHTYGTATTLKSATKAGFDFGGWYKESACTNKVTSLGATTYTSDITLYAKWTENKVYYNVVSGVKSFAGSVEQSAKANLSIEATKGEYDEANHKALANSVLKFTVSNVATGYEIEGWYSDETCTSEIDGAGTSNEYSTPAVAGPVNVYVKILATQYNITYNNVYGTNPNPSSYNVEDEITFHPIIDYRTGYTFDGWSPASISKGTTGAQTVTAQWQAKTYTISFDQNEGTGGQTETVTATYDQAMPTLSSFTAPVKNGYKFLGYEYNGTLYYNADGTSASTWNVDNNVTLTAKWDQIYVYIEGRFKVRTTLDGNTWIYTGDKDGDYVINSKTIEFVFDDVNNVYTLNTWAYLNELIYSGGDNLYFHIATWTATDGFTQLGATSADNFWFNKNKPENMSSSLKVDGSNFLFKRDGDDDFSGPAILTYDPAANTLSYTAEPEPTHSVTFISGGRGHINNRDDVKQFVAPVGIRSGYNITATPDKGFTFEQWTVTGGVEVDNANSSSTSITVTGAGTITANFLAAPTRVYFQKPSAWKGEKVYMYLYNDSYWNDEYGSGAQNTLMGATEMQYYGEIYGRYTYYCDFGWDKSPKGYISFATENQDGSEYFYNASVTYRGDYKHCSVKNMFVTDKDQEGKKKKGENPGVYYNEGQWMPFSIETVEFYMKTNSSDKALDKNRFKPTANNSNIRVAVMKDLVKDQEYPFYIWQTCNCRWGCSATVTGNVDNYQFYDWNNDNFVLKPKYAGDYELTLNISTMQLSVKYLADFYVRSFPEAVSVVPHGIKRIEPKIDLRDGYDVEELDINIEVEDNTIATVEQSGYNIIVTGKENGTTTATITYDYKGNKFKYELTIVVGPAVTIQAKIEDGDTKWIYTNMVNVHYWLDEKTADVNMTYTESGDDKYYTASIPLPEDQETFNMMFWYGENIEMSATNEWRKTADIEDLNIYTDGTKAKTQSYCFTIKHTDGGVDEQRTETHDEGLCIEGDAIYQVEVTMKNGKMYTSNVVSTNGETVSFFAPNTSATDYTKGTIRLMKNGVEIMEMIDNTTPGVYTATLNIPAEGNATLSALTAYPGPFYVLSGLSGTEVDATTGKNAMNQFTPRANTNEDYSFYWTAYTNSAAYKDNKNTIATVANEWNSNLSLTIGADKKTASDGTVDAGNVRFSYEPTTNEFKRAIIGGSTENPKFLAIVGNNVYDVDGTTALNDAEYALEDTKCKFTDASDWVYEKNIVIKPDGKTDANVYIKAQFNGVLTELLGYMIDPETGEETTTPKPLTVMGKATTSGTYNIRIIYDYKKNRLLSAWEPQEQTISTDMTIESDVMFISQEDGDVKQVTIGDVTEGTPAKLTSLQNVMYVKEFLQTGNLKTYWMSLPFDCRVSDIYGIGGYGTVWRIQEYDGKTRAEKGWLNESQTFWRTMTMDDEMKAGYGYLLQIVRTKMNFHQIDDKAALRLYFPSKDKGFTMTRSDEGKIQYYTDEKCNIKGREAEDSNWKLMGPLAYNNIKLEEVNWADGASQPEEDTRFPSYIYEYDAESKTYNVVLATDRTYRSFHAFMTQFGGTIEWKPYTETTKPGEAPRFADLSDSFKGGRLTIELVQNNEQLDRTFVTLSQFGTEGFDQNKDLTKIAESRSTISTITNDVEYAGNTLPLNTELVPLNVKVTTKGTYDIALSESLNGLEVNLYDAFEQTTTPLDMMSATIILDKGEYKDRFFLQFKQKGSDTPTSFDGKLEQYNLPADKTQKLFINDNIYLINGGRVYNASGTKVK